MTKTQNRAVLIKNPRLVFVILTILGFILLYIARVQTESIKDHIVELTISRGALLEILTTLPFIFIYLILINLVIFYFGRINNFVFNSATIDFVGKYNKSISKNEIKEIHIVKSKEKGKIFRIIFMMKHSAVYSLNFFSDDVANEVIHYFDLTNADPTITETNDEMREIYKL